MRLRVVGGVLWLAWVVSTSGRLWLGGVAQIRRECAWIRELLRVRACGALQGLLRCTDGLSSYPEQVLKAFGEPLRAGKRGCCRLLLPEGLMVAQGIRSATSDRGGSAYRPWYGGGGTDSTELYAGQ